MNILPNGDYFAILAFCSQTGPVGALQNLTQRIEALIFSVHVVCVVVVENLNLSFGRLRQKNSTKVRVARAARLFFLLQPIRL